MSEGRAALPSAVDGTEQRLDAVLDELRGLRQDLADVFGAKSTDAGDVEELRGVSPPPRRKRGAS